VGEATYFWTSNESGPAFGGAKGEGYLSSADWSVPILWSMCFSAADVNVRLPSAGVAVGVSCDATRVEAIARIERRMPSLLKLLPAHLHDAAQVFLDRLRQSTASYVHLDLSIIQAGEEDDFEVEAWAWEYWGPLLDGLETPVPKLRTGLAARVMGAGVPNGWEGLCRWSVGNEQLPVFMSPGLPVDRVAGGS
jgi:hypothetical protein